MAIQARKLCHAQLPDAVRFRSDWEGTTSLAIHAGDASALATYDRPGPLHGGDVRHGSIKRVASAVGEGPTTIQFAGQYPRRDVSDQPLTSLPITIFRHALTDLPADHYHRAEHFSHGGRGERS
jgi:hypothetical protein